MSSKKNTPSLAHDAPSTLVPRLRFPEFEGAGEWMLRSLRDVAIQILDGDWIESKDQSESGIRLIQTGNIGVGTFVVKSGKARYISEETFNRLKCTEVFPGDCLISRLPDPAGRSCFLPDTGQRMITAVDCSIVRFKREEIVPEMFLAHSQTDAYFREIDALSSGSTRQRVSRENLSNVVIALPSLPEQQRIASCLSSLDELITAQAQKVEALKTHKKGLMQQLFPREGETQPRLRFPEFEGEWEEKTLGQLAKLVRGPFGGSLKKEMFVADGYAVYEQQHAIYSNFDNFRYRITHEKYLELRRFAVAVNDLIMSCSGTMGRFAIVPNGAAPGVINQALLKLTPSEYCDSKFMVEMLKLPSSQEKLLSQSAGGAIQNVVSVEQIKALGLRIPSIVEQQRIASCFSSLDELITNESNKLDVYKTHKKGLMQGLFPNTEESTK